MHICDPEQHHERTATRATGDETYWPASVACAAEFPPLAGNLETDVVIVGAGLAGMSIAYSLTREGKQCTVVDVGSMGYDQVANSGGYLSSGPVAQYARLNRIHHPDRLRIVIESHNAAINWIQRTIKREDIHCDFERLDGYLFLRQSDRVKTLQEEFEATRNAGLCTELVTTAPDILSKEKIALRFPLQAQFHPLKYLKGLQLATQKHGTSIFADTNITNIDDHSVTAGNFRIDANHVVIATNYMTQESSSNKERLNRSQSYAMARYIHKDLVTRNVWWETADPFSKLSTPSFRYARIQPYDEEFDLLISGSIGHVLPDSQTERNQNFEILESWTSQRFPLVRDVAYEWSYQTTDSPDMLAFIGKNPGENIYVAKGSLVNELTYGAIAGMLISDLIMERKNPWQTAYLPSRSIRLPEKGVPKPSLASG